MFSTAHTTRDGRVFHACLLACAYASKCWQYGSLDPARPVFAVFAGPSAEMRPFLANIREDGKLRMFGDLAHGRDSKGSPLEFMRSAVYCYESQTHDLASGPAVDPETGRRRQERPGVVTTIYLPALYDLDPAGGIDDDPKAPFHYICMPGRQRLEREADLLDNREIVSHLQVAGFTAIPASALRTFGAHAALICAGVDRRVDIPIIHDPRFYAQLLAALLDARLASWSVARADLRNSWRRPGWGHNIEVSYIEEGTAELGYAPGICVSATREQAIKVIGVQTARFERIMAGLDPDAGEASTLATPAPSEEDAGAGSDPDPEHPDRAV